MGLYCYFIIFYSSYVILNTDSVKHQALSLLIDYTKQNRHPDMHHIQSENHIFSCSLVVNSILYSSIT